MLHDRSRLSNGFLVPLSLPGAAVCLALSSGIAAMTSPLSRRCTLRVANIARNWLMNL
jgi:hypothetical protein